MSRICLFGGSFNPPHVCHVLATSWAISTLPIDKVWWVPTYAHAFGKHLLPYEDREAMARDAVAMFGERVRVSDIEREMGGQSRSIDTLEFLWRKHPEHDFSLLIGADILEETDRWKAWDRIEATTPIHVLGRGTHGRGGETFGITLPDVSSSQLRKALARRDWDFCTPRAPAAVLERIRRHGWYGAGDA